VAECGHRPSELVCQNHNESTALASYEVCDINPDRIHVTLPKGRRIRRRGGELYVVHHEDLAPEQIGWWQQIPTVTLATAIAQCITTGVPGYLVRQALAAARDRGALTQAAVDELESRDGG
jgi:predicted transcriptional regulator of viral defense system